MRYNIPDRVLRDIARFAKENGIGTVTLFGSRARGTHTPRSDIDLAVTDGDALGFKLDLNERANTLLTFDVVDLGRDIGDELKKDIERDGVVIYDGKQETR